MRGGLGQQIPQLVVGAALNCQLRSLLLEGRFRAYPILAGNDFGREWNTTLFLFIFLGD